MEELVALHFRAGTGATPVHIKTELLKQLDTNNEKEYQYLLQLACCSWQPEDMKNILDALEKLGADKEACAKLLELETVLQEAEDAEREAHPYIMSQEDIDMMGVEYKTGLVPVPTATKYDKDNIIW